MRSLIVMAMFSASLADAAWNDYEEVRDLELDANGVSEFEIDAGAGSMQIMGDADAASIQVTATISVDTSDEEKARSIIADDIELTLERKGDKAVLKSLFDGRDWGDIGASVKLEIVVPTGIPLDIDDGSGSLLVDGTEAALKIDDGSGSIKIYKAGAVEIDDGSGSIVIEGATGDVDIIDGSGSITISTVGGSVRVDDGSGSINIDDVAEDVIIEEDGSGGLSVSNVGGNVETDT